MSQVGEHANLVSIIGVVTRGDPLVLIISYCEHGSLISLLKRRCFKERSPLGAEVKLQLGLGIAKGMEHLSSRLYVHRDLAARNVLVATGMVAQVADFGLSRGIRSTRAAAAKAAPPSADTGDGGNIELVTAGNGDDIELQDIQHNDGDGEYYRSQAGIFPIRWSAPEAMETLKFTVASDVWSFGIVMVEMYQNGAHPYSELAQQSVVSYVIAGHIHEQPHQCTPQVYELLRACWSFDPNARPRFNHIVQALQAIIIEANTARTENEHQTITAASPAASTEHARATPSVSSAGARLRDPGTAPAKSAYGSRVAYGAYGAPHTALTQGDNGGVDGRSVGSGSSVRRDDADAGVPAGPVDICTAEAGDSHHIRCETVMDEVVQSIHGTTLPANDASSLARTPQTSLYGRGIQQETVYGHSYPAHASNPYGKPRHVDDSRRQVRADDASYGKTAVTLTNGLMSPTMYEMGARAQAREGDADADVAIAPPRAGNLLDNRVLVAPTAPLRQQPLHDAGPDANYLQVVAHTAEVGNGGNQSSEEESDDGEFDGVGRVTSSSYLL